MSSFSSLSASLIARQIARASRPRPWLMSPPLVKPAPLASSTSVPSSTLSSLKKSVIVRATARAFHPRTLSAVSSFASSKRTESVRSPLTLSDRAAARASRDRPWLNPRSGSIAAKVSKSTSKTAQWIRSQAVAIQPSDASMLVPAPEIKIPKRRTIQPSDASMVVPAPEIKIPKRRTAPTSSRPRPVVPPASPEKSIAAIVREAWAFDINEFRADVKQITDKIEGHRKWLRCLVRKPVTFDDNPKVIEYPRWIEKDNVHPRPPSIVGYILGWRRYDETNPYGHTVIWGTDTSNFDHSNCANPDCNRRAKDYMLNYEEWTPPIFSTMSE